VDNARTSSWFFVVVAVIQADSAVADAVAGDWIGVALRMTFMVALLLTPRFLRRTRDRVDAAERSALALLDPP